MATSPVSALKYLEQNSDHFLADLKGFLRIPSVSNDEAHQSDIQVAAEWVANRLRQLPMQLAEILPTEGHPIVYGENLKAGNAAPTILIYGHYDVQSPDPLSDWVSPPFEPTIRGENLYARGATDMKGQVMASLNAVEALTRSGTLGVNIKVLVEGEEEIGSPHLKGFLILQRERLACDYVLNPDSGGMPNPNTPVITYSLRGGAWFKLTILGPKQDIHSGLFGGVVHNPIHALSHLIAGLQDGTGRITLQDFYKQVRSLDASERSELGQLPLGKDYFLEQTGVPALWGEEEFTPLERTVARPSMDVVQFEAGHPKAAIPAKATALIAFRLVPDQDPNEVHQQLRRFLETHAVPTVKWELEFLGGDPPVLTSRGSTVVQTLKRALETAFEAQPIFQRMGWSNAAVLMFQKSLGVDSVLTGFSLSDDNFHGPNEKLHLPTWKKGMAALIHFFCNTDRAR